VANVGGKRPTQAASQYTFINAQYTLLVISGNDKDKQLTILGQRKLALGARNLRYKIIGTPKNVKNGPVLYFGLKLTMHVIKSQIHLVRQSL
jgi:hypothetical protein